MLDGWAIQCDMFSIVLNKRKASANERSVTAQTGVCVPGGGRNNPMAESPSRTPPSESDTRAPHVDAKHAPEYIARNFANWCRLLSRAVGRRKDLKSITEVRKRSVR